MGAYLDKPITKKEIKQASANDFRATVCSMQGWRSTMEVFFNRSTLLPHEQAHWDSLFLRCSRTPALSSVPSPATRRPVSLVFLMAMVAFMPLRSGISSLVLPSAINPLLCSMDHLLDHLLKQEEYKGPNVSFSSLQSHWRVDDPRRLRDGLQEGLPQVR